MLDSQFLFNLPRFRAQINPQQFGTKAGADQDHTQGAEDIANRVRNSDVSNPLLLLIVRY